MTRPGNQVDYFKRIFNAFDDMVFVLDKEAVFLDYVPAHSQKLVAPKEAFIGRHVGEVLPPAICNEIISGINQLDGNLTDCYQFEYPLMQDYQHWYSANITRIPESENASGQFLAVVRDVTKSKEDQLLLEDILRYTKHGVIYLKAFHDEYGNLVDFECKLFNEEASRLSKKCPDQLRNAPLSTFLDPKWFPHFFKILCHTLETGEGFSETRNYLSAEEEPPLWAAISISRLNDGLLVNITDITDQVIMNDELQHSNTYLKDLNGEKDEILSALTHDLRGPLSGMLGLLQLMKVERLSESERKTYETMLETSAMKMENMLMEMLTWQYSGEGDKTHTEVTLRMKEEVERIMEETVQAEHKQIRILNRVPDNYSWTGNRGMLCCILRNLINNAVKFSHSGSEIHIDAAVEQKKVVLGFRDFGIGMNQEQIHNLLYSGLPSSTLGTSGEKGSGMGIRIVKGFIERMGGELAIESNPNKGSHFKVTLPVRA